MKLLLVWSTMPPPMMEVQHWSVLSLGWRQQDGPTEQYANKDIVFNKRLLKYSRNTATKTPINKVK